MAALPPRDAINTQIATTKFLGTTSINICASRYQSRSVFLLFTRSFERISDIQIRLRWREFENLNLL